MSPSTYDHDDFLAALVDRILKEFRASNSTGTLPVTCDILGLKIVYNRVEKRLYDYSEKRSMVESWTYSLYRDDGTWAMKMTNRPSDAERVWEWIAEGDLEVANRDLALLKLATAV